ncbi:integrase core domain-containing protein [Paracoccaceae bacterium]|nr:integrase core domain-containing protein [Paracoccaceae bacterium]
MEHRLTKPNHAWTNGQVERMNRILKWYHCDNHEQMRIHLSNFTAPYNFARQLKMLKGLTPHEYICKIWTSELEKFIVKSIYQMSGLNT